MRIRVANKITIEYPPQELRNWCRQNLTIPNPDYYKREAMGKWTGGTPESITLYEQAGNTLLLPFGALQDVWRICGQQAEWKLEIAKKRTHAYGSNIQLYDYQQEAVEAALRKKNGILVMPCGAGKTQSGLEIIARIGGRALWLTHTQDLLNQSRKRAESVLQDTGTGTITEGKINAGNGITFATVQTMTHIDLTQYRDFWDTIIVDECQHCAGSPTRVSQFYKVMSNLSARYKIGLTATPHRADGLERSMFALLGDIIHEVDRDAVADTTCPIEVHQIETGWMPDPEAIIQGDGTIDYAKVIEALTTDDERYKLVWGEAMQAATTGATLILANRVEFLRSMQEDMLAYDAKVMCLSGAKNTKKAKAERKEALRMLNDGELDAILATYQLAKEGLDVPNLRYIVMATPEKDETTVIQSVGRVGRAAEGKTKGVALDFLDNFGLYRGWAKKRETYYKKIGARIIRDWSKDN